MIQYPCDILEAQLKRMREEFWWLTPAALPLPGEYIINQAHGRYYESTEELATRRREWLINQSGKTSFRFNFDGEAETIYVGSLTDETEIIFSWLRGEDIEHGKRTVPGEPVIRGNSDQCSGWGITPIPTST